MFDVGWDELLFTGVIAVIVIGPKDLPMALRTAGRWIAKARSVSNHFRSGIEAMIREAELEDLEKKWKEQNEAVMREHPGQEMTALNADGSGPLTPPEPVKLLPEADAEAQAQAAAPEGAVPQAEPQDSK
jgi:sec-independent protein translocase protein TatB